MLADRAQYVIQPFAAHDPQIGRLLWLLEDTRARTRQVLTDITPGVLDWIPPEGGNTIGTLLYHVAVIEADWLYAEVLEREFPPELVARFAVDVRDDAGTLARVIGWTLAEYDALLGIVRAHLLDTFRTMTSGDFRRPRSLPRYDVTPEWVLHHLMQHEAEHRGQIGDLRRRAEMDIGAPGG